jgi:hypothetical protein
MRMSLLTVSVISFVTISGHVKRSTREVSQPRIGRVKRSQKNVSSCVNLYQRFAVSKRAYTPRRCPSSCLVDN